MAATASPLTKVALSERLDSTGTKAFLPYDFTLGPHASATKPISWINNLRTALLGSFIPFFSASMRPASPVFSILILASLRICSVSSPAFFLIFHSLCLKLSNNLLLSFLEMSSLGRLERKSSSSSTTFFFFPPPPPPEAGASASYSSPLANLFFSCSPFL